LSWRIWIPVHVRGELVTWTTRSIGDGGYVSARPEEERTPIKHCLYGLDHCRHVAVVVEGPADVWKIGPGAVATFGVSYTQEQVALLAEIPIRVVCFDREVGAQRQATKLCRALEAHPGSTCRVELDAEDPGSASEEEVSALRKRFFSE
jgi:DNA primase